MQKITKLPPWRRKTPKGSGGAKMTAEEVREARARAEKNGRPYPNLVDNMAVIRERGKKER